MILIFTLFALSCSSQDKKAFSESKWAQAVEKTRVEDLYASNYAEGRFFLPWMKMKDKNFLDVLGWKLFSKANFTPEEKSYLPDILTNTAVRLEKTQGDFVLWIGHNTFLIRINGIYWMTDPIFSKRALLPPRVTPPALSLEEFNTIIEEVNILISHNHYDHLDRPSMKKLPEHASVYVPKGLKTYVMGMNKTNVHEMNWWESIDVGNGSTLICLPAQHWSLRMNQGRNQSLWASFLLKTPKVTFYFGGDSGYFKGFGEFGRKYPQIDYAFMAITAYQPRWFMHFQHMNVAEAVKAFEALGAKHFIPTQWGTFPLGSEPAGYPGLDLKRYLKKNPTKTSQFKIMDIGQILPLES